MLIPDAFLTAEIRETNDLKEYEMVFMKVAVPMNQPHPVVSTQGTNRNTPRAHKSPTVSVGALETKKRKQTVGESSALRRMCRRQGYMIQDMERKCVTTTKFWETHNEIDDILHEIVPQIAKNVTNDLIEANLKPCIANTIIEDRDAF
ncbi:hypothetical protein Tco_1342516 [Tanacetum coccineum]